MTDEQKKKCSYIVRHYGSRSQFHKAVEEMAELIVALCKFMAGEDTLEHVCEEVADVAIMTEQLQCIVGHSEVQKMIDYKLNRQLDRIEEGEKNEEP